ncbi:molybdopterin-dependent oxidoreductase [Candidatus Leptofilum sp.]|uniref:molybdopterin-dependent oxidoreductase n=1 Tax=Candidatus Leptofilum sp. TaxID=3241576 RepID=UPI003B5C11D1
MKTPWANVVLLILIVVQALSGYFGTVNGRISRAWILWAHGIGAYALLVLLYWKGGIVLDAIRRKTVWTRRRLAFAGMFSLLLIVIFSGLLWTFSGPIYLGGFSLVSLHIYLAVPLLLLMAWHAWHMRFIWRVPGAVGRRLFMGTAVSTLLGLLIWRAADWGKEVVALPGANRRFTGSYERGSFTGRFPVVSWINDNPPPIDVASWQLVVDGAVKRPYSLAYDQLRELTDVAETAVVDCTGGWYSEQVWRGVSLAQLLEMAELDDTAASLSIISVTGYQRRFTLEQASRYFLALEVADAPLSHGHGFPVRLVAPDQRGAEWVKWITHLRLNPTSKIWQLPLPLQ